MIYRLLQLKYKYLKLIPFGKNALVLKFPYLRRSYQTKRPVNEILFEAMPQTVILAFVAMFLASLLGIFFGVIAAIKQILTNLVDAGKIKIFV